MTLIKTVTTRIQSGIAISVMCVTWLLLLLRLLLLQAGQALNEQLMFAEELESEFRIPTTTWRYWHYSGRGPRSYKLGRRRVWRRSEVLAWLREQGLDLTA